MKRRKYLLVDNVDELTDIKYFFRKYNYNINEVVGVKGKKKFILFADKKLIRIYRGNLKSFPLLCSYLPIEEAIFYSFKIERGVLKKIDLKAFVETKVYEEAGLNEIEEYIIKYKVVDFLKNDKFVQVEVVIIPSVVIDYKYKDLLQQTGYIDYVSFPAFSYKSLYDEKIINKRNDLFVVILKDKMFLTFYSNGELVYIKVLVNGLDKIFNELEKLKIKNFDWEIFRKLLLKKGLLNIRYKTSEFVILSSLEKAFKNLFSMIKDEISKIVSVYNISEVERLFVSTEFGDIPGFNEFIKKFFHINTYNFEFYEKYNLDRLPIEPFLFLAMLETHYAYKSKQFDYNFSTYLRKPNFLYRPSGQLVGVVVVSFLISLIFPLVTWIKGLELKSESYMYVYERSDFETQIDNLKKKFILLEKKNFLLKQKISQKKKKVFALKKYIKDIYDFKFSYFPKSKELVKIGKLLNSLNIYATNIQLNNGTFVFKVFSYREDAIPELIKILAQTGFNVLFENIVYKNGKYYSVLRIKV